MSRPGECPVHLRPGKRAGSPRHHPIELSSKADAIIPRQGEIPRDFSLRDRLAVARDLTQTSCGRCGTSDRSRKATGSKDESPGTESSKRSRARRAAVHPAERGELVPIQMGANRIDATRKLYVKIRDEHLKDVLGFNQRVPFRWCRLIAWARRRRFKPGSRGHVRYGVVA
jgi:hypothetical protein